MEQNYLRDLVYSELDVINFQFCRLVLELTCQQTILQLIILTRIVISSIQFILLLTYPNELVSALAGVVKL